MKKIDIKKAQKDLFNIVDKVNNGTDYIKIENNGKNAIIISEYNWNSIQETLYLSSISGFVEDIKNIEKNEDWSKANKFIIKD